VTVVRAATRSVGQTRAVAAEVAAFTRPGDLILLSGDLGAGKTAFAQGLARGLGVEETVTSPAFVLARSYDGRLPMLHLDVYRLDHLQELVDMGIAELVDEGAVTVVEWGDVATPVLPPDFLEVGLEMGDGDDDRTLAFTAVGPSWPPRMTALERALGTWAVEAGAC
jgi:tRNA threonylcarbamoyladenosine biosynthesis protein TsaE